MSSKQIYYKEKSRRKDSGYPDSRSEYDSPRKDGRSGGYPSRYKRGVGDSTPPRFRMLEGNRTESESYDEENMRLEDMSMTDGGIMTREYVPSDSRRNDQKPDAKPFSDDSRLSKLVRRFCREDEKERRLATASQLQETMLSPENMKAIVRNSDALLTLLFDILTERTYRDVKHEASVCISIVGQVMGRDAQKYFQWMFSKIQAVHSAEYKVLLLQALLETLQTQECDFTDFVQMILSHCQVVIENADKPEVLMAIVNVLVYISERYPNTFSPHFRDTVDILVGWHIDSTQKDHVIEMTSESLIRLHEFWIEDMDFSMTLLGQFLEDMEAYAEDLGFGLNGNELDEDMPTPYECIIKIASLLRVFTTVAQSLGDYFHPDSSSEISLEYLLDVTCRIIKCIDNTINQRYNERILHTANKCLLLLCNSLGSSTAEVTDQLLSYLISQLHSDQHYSNKLLLAMFALIQRSVELIGPQVPEKFIGDLYSEHSLVYSVRHAHSHDVITQLIKITHVTFNIKSVPVMEETYRYILGDMEVALNTLMKLCDFEPNVKLVKQNPYSEVKYTCTRAETSLIFDICALAEIGNNKSNIIGMWALTPSLFELLLHQLLRLDPLFLEQYPALYYALLQTLYSHCIKHGHFLTSSILLTQKTAIGGSLMANVSSQTAERFTDILRLLADIHNSYYTPYDARCLATKWSLDIIEALSSTPEVYTSRDCQLLVQALVASGYTTESESTLSICECLKAYLFHADHVPEPLLRMCVDLCSIKMAATEVKVKEEFTELLKQIPVDVSTRKQEGVVHKVNKKRRGRRGTAEAFWMARRFHMTKTPTGTFHSHNFRAVMGFILENIKPSALCEDDWLERMYFSSQRIDKETLQPPPEIINMSSLVPNNSALLWFWATWEAAQFCTLAKLRTPLGKPQDTFMSIEAALKAYVAEVKKLKAPPGESMANGDAETTEKDTEDDPGVKEQNSLLRVRVLLQFMENLEKLLYNAYEGVALAMIAPPKVVRTFFRTNRPTCKEWLLRIRMCVMVIAEHSGQPAMVVRQAWELMRDMHEGKNSQGAEFERVLVLAVQALIKLRCPEAIQGLYAWCKDVLGRKLNWMKAAVEMASNKFESGAQEFKLHLKQLIHPDPNMQQSEVKKEERSRSTSSSPLGSPSQQSFMENAKISIMSKKDSAASLSTNAASTNDIEPLLAKTFTQQICDAYMRLGNYSDVLQWQDTLSAYQDEVESEEMKKALVLNIEDSYLQALSRFEDCDFMSVQDRLACLPGASVASVGKEQPRAALCWSPACVLQAAQQNYMRGVTLCQTSTDSQNDMSPARECVKWSVDMCEMLRGVQCLTWPAKSQEHSLCYLYGVHACHSQLQTDSKPKSWMIPVCEPLKLDPLEHDVATWMQALTYVRVQHRLQDVLSPEKSVDFEGLLSKLSIATARLARKQQNYACAESLLTGEIHGCLSVEPTSDSESMDMISEALEKLHVNNSPNASVIKLLNIEREAAKLIRDTGKSQKAIEELSGSTVRYADIASQLKGPKSSQLVGSCSELKARSVVTLVSWLQHDSKHLASLASQVKHIGQGDENAISAAAENLKILLELEKLGASKEQGLFKDNMDDNVCELANNPILSDSDAVVGRLLHYSTMQCPTLSKAWFSLANWCYKWGRKSVDNAVHGSIELSESERAQIIELLPRGTSVDETESVLAILSQLNTRVTGEEDISDQDQTLYDDGTETTRKQLLGSCLSLQIASEECVDRLIDVWRGVVRRVYHYYQLSAKAYFIYLNLNGQGQGEETNMDGNITTTLRLLRLLVKHAWELRGVLEKGLANTPTVPWKGIIPQLFSRLSHPEAYVRQSVSELLCRVAQDAPHLIVYPAVVGASANEKLDNEAKGNVILNEYLSTAEDERADGEEDKQSQDEEDEGAENTGSDDMLKNCFTAIVDTLANSNPQMISEVQLLVSELRRITLLWEELWLGTLNQHHQDVTRHLNQLENEVKKVMANAHLSKDEKTAIIKEKHNTVLKPTLYTMERLAEITSGTAETPNEKWFQDTYGKLIQDALQRLREPSNPSNPHASWQLFKQLHHSLQQKAAKRSSLVLSMDEISDKLSQLKHTVIAMPGISTAGQQVVTIGSVQNAVHILATKTKPKKMVLLGSDGRKYPYLFKGLEDLHLDERIMQFLAIVNNMFAKANRGERKLYHARHYSVTPLGARSGLIQWVDGATPLFSLYKRWQQREALAQQQKNLPPGASSSAANQPSIPRPSEVFYSKLNPLLKKDNLTTADSRKDWPMSTMRRVLEELMQETPGDLLAKELWCCSTSASEWWRITQTYSRSTAVMSVIGYIIGLGDRHLDNVLVDLHSGEVVHIDYNVCFEKGKSLRVPERVPFRITQNLEKALGVTGVEGLFRLSCEYVLKTMRKGRETLLTLLEAFVYDPLVDWTTGNETGYTGAFYGGGHSVTGLGETRKNKKQMEREITRSMFSIRVAEMKGAWLKNKDEMLSLLPQLKESVSTHLEASNAVNELEENSDKYKNQIMYLEEGKDDMLHPLYTLAIRYHDFAVVRDTRLAVEKEMQVKLADCAHWYSAHASSLALVQTGLLQQRVAQLTHTVDLGLACFMPVLDFLNTSGQQSLASQCQQASAELNTAVLSRREVLRGCVDVLHTYATMVSHFPASFVQESRTTRWQHWLQEIVCDFTSGRVEHVLSECDALYGLTSTANQARQQTVRNTHNRLQIMVQEASSKLIKFMERRSSEGVDLCVLEGACGTSMMDVHSFMREQGHAGACCMTSVVVSMLCSLCKRYLTMETAAGAAAERLMDLTSREGDWFLDELCSMSANVNHLLQALNDPALCQLQSADMCQKIAATMKASDSVYTSLQELNVNFRTIIVPETVKSLECGEASVVSALDNLDRILVTCPKSLDSLIASLERQLMNAIMGLETVDEDTVTAVRKMRVKYEELLQGSNPETTTLTPGQMLLMGFNGLFTRLDAEFQTMLDQMSKVTGPDIWRKVDVIKEARSIQLTAYTEMTLGVLDNIFFVRQMKAMQSFFTLAKQHAATLQGTAGKTSLHDDEQLAKPVKFFIAEYVRKHMIGLPSQSLGHILCHYVSALHVDVTAEIELRDIGAECKVSLEELCKKAIESNLKNGIFEHIHLTQATTLISSSDGAWRACDLVRRLDNNISVLQASFSRLQLQLARFQWLHEDDVMVTSAVVPNRASVMADLGKSVQNLQAFEAPVSVVLEKHAHLEASVTQRLKWGAGANPTLAASLKEFEEILANKDTVMQSEAAVCTEVVSTCNSILHFEALRTQTPEAVSADATFLSLLNKIKQACDLAESCDTAVTEIEEGLCESVSIPEVVSGDWIEESLDLVTSQRTELSTRQQQLEEKQTESKDAVTEVVSTMTTVLTSHHKLMSDVRSILRTLAKQEEHELGVEVLSGGVRDYVNTYKAFSENLTSLLKLANSEHITPSLQDEIQTLINTLSGQIDVIYGDLIKFAPPLNPDKVLELESASPLNFANILKKNSESNLLAMSPKKGGLLMSRTELLTATPSSATSSQQVGAVKISTPGKKLEKIVRDPKTGKAVQEKNSYAVGVWRRIKMKLDGRDPDQSKRFTVPEQVDFIIREATSLDNLCVLYEGWTPWV